MNEQLTVATDSSWQSRTAALLGTAALDRLSAARVILLGCGGVGGWAAEALIRTGVGHLTLVDKDVVEPSNLNRQLVATRLSLGRPKVEALRERLLAINPDADILTRHDTFCAANADTFALESYHVVIDAIDSVADKALLIRLTCQLPHTALVSAMGAARRTDPLQVRVAEFAKVAGCPLARALRNRFRKEGQWPARKFRCVWSAEPPREGAEKGSLATVVGTFGMVLAQLAIDELLSE